MSSQRIALVWAQFNSEITRGLVSGALRVFEEAGVQVQPRDIFEVPGAFELPLIAKRLAASKHYDAVVTLGCVIKGDTLHFEFVSLGVTLGIQNVSIETGVPILFGVLTTQTEEQAQARSVAGDLATNKGAETARACLDVLKTLERVPL